MVLRNTDMNGGPVIVLDNGAGNIKVGFCGEAAPRRVFPNCSAKAKGERQLFIGDALLDCKEISQLTLRRPFDRGYLINWDLEQEIWGRIFRNVLKVNTRDCGLLMTEPMFNFPQIQAYTEQVVFEEFGLQSFYAAPAPVFSLRRAAALQPQLPASQAGSGVIVDAGFSFTHVVPFFNWHLLPEGSKRINIGGKALTNYLKELVTYRSLNMMDETYLMEHIKDTLSFVSQDVRKDLRLCQQGIRSPYRKEFVLPDGVNNLRGYVREQAAGPNRAGEGAGPRQTAVQQQVLVLNNERFMVSELLFHPSDIQLSQAGVSETITQAVQATHPALHPLLYTNVVLTGGVAGCPGFYDRMCKELRPLVPDDYDLNVYMPPDPSLCAWEGMSLFASSGDYSAMAMTRAQYEETGGSVGRQHR